MLDSILAQDDGGTESESGSEAPSGGESPQQGGASESPTILPDEANPKIQIRGEWGKEKSQKR